MNPWTLILISGLAFLCVGLVAQFSTTITLGGISIQKTANRTGDHSNGYDVEIPVAYSVSAWVKTDANTAACNLPASHGQTSGTYDVYWTGGQRIGVTGTVTVNALALDGGAGTDFPATADLTVVVCKQVAINTAIDGDNVSIYAHSLDYVDPAATSVGHISYRDVGVAEIEAFDLAANSPFVLDITGGATNTLAGNPITTAVASHNNTTYAASLKILSLEDSTA